MRLTVIDEACCFVIIEIQWKFLLGIILLCIILGTPAYLYE